jgi:hypothetical protein
MTMHLKTAALAAALALTSSLAFAQAGGNDAGSTIPENSGTAVNGGGRSRWHGAKWPGNRPRTRHHDGYVA